MTTVCGAEPHPRSFGRMVVEPRHCILPPGHDGMHANGTEGYPRFSWGDPQPASKNRACWCCGQIHQRHGAA